MNTVKHLGVLTSGGDAPGMNAAIRAVVRTALDHKLRVTGIERGYWGLLEEDFINMSSRSVGGIINRGGTILRTVRCPEFRDKANRTKAYRNIKKAGLDGIVVIGGNGSAAAAYTMHKEIKIPVASVPVSIDNDVYGSDDTVGFDSSVNTAVEAIDKIRDTATSHERIFVVEVMGRDNGFIALETALSSGAEALLVPEFKYDLDKIVKGLVHGHKRGKVSSIIVMAEGAGDCNEITDHIKKQTGLRVRLSVLGYIQRGGNPTSHSRVLAAKLGNQAVKNILNGNQAHLSGIKGGELVAVPLKEVFTKKKKLSRDLYKLVYQMAQ